ncbi:hypothetical protein RV134_200071 [Roseovarius sp. EC-HK134]|jgi:hypothetical protein|nr:hypothetical protein RV420_200015 [Roseovarius sp. EC-SD190]VVS99455.1 hypothetical protein RV134_200071 [Roseovarius sp. EC-HK134]
MSILLNLSPAMAEFRAGEPLRAGLGALVGITLCAVVVSLDYFVPSSTADAGCTGMTNTNASGSTHGGITDQKLPLRQPSLESDHSAWCRSRA